MPADVQQIIKSTRPAPTRPKKPAATAGEDFGCVLKRANKPKPKPTPETKDHPVEQKPVKPPTDELPVDEAQATAEAPQETDKKSENKELAGDHPDEHHEPAGEDYAAALVVTPQPLAVMDNPPVVEQDTQSADPQQAAEVLVLNQQSTQTIATQDGPPVLKTTPDPFSQASVSQVAAPTNPQPSADPAAQAGAQPMLKMGEPLDTPADNSDSSASDRNQARQTNPLPNPNTLNAEMAATQSAIVLPDSDRPASIKPDLNAKLDMVIAPPGDSSTPKAVSSAAIPSTSPPPVAPEAQFAQANHANIVTALRSEIAGSNGTMHIRLDPPELGALQVTVHMRDGIMSAAFETTNDEATKLLSHSLTQLKQVLESQGVSIDKLHVQQSARSDKPTTGDEHQQQQNHHDGHSAQQEQQRKEMIRRMWRRLGLGNDPLDLVA